MNVVKRHSHVIGGLVFFAIVATLPLWLLTGPYLQGLGVSALVVASLSVAWNLVGGYAGRLSFGHAAFFGLGAYTSSLLLIHFDVSPWIGAVAGMLVAGLTAILLGSLTTHLRGIYFTLVTFVFSLLLMNLARYFTGFTGGDVGLSLPLTQPSFAMMQFRGQTAWYYLALVMLLAFMVISWLLVRSPFGFRLRAIRDDVDVARALGVKTEAVKLEVFTLSAMMVAFAGTVVAQHQLFIDPGGAFGLGTSVEMALGAIFGGVGTLWGPVVGGIAIVLIGEGARLTMENVFPGADVIVYGIILVAVALWLPGGLASIPQKIRAMHRRRRGSERAGADTAPPTGVVKEGASP